MYEPKYDLPLAVGLSLAVSVGAIFASGFSSDDNGDTGGDTAAVTDPTDGTDTSDVTDTTDTDTDADGTTISSDQFFFVEDALVSDPTIVNCTMSDGTETMCYEIVIEGVPADSAVGPFCPRGRYSKQLHHCRL